MIEIIPASEGAAVENAELETSFLSEDEYDHFVDLMRIEAIEYAKHKNAESWLLDSLSHNQHIDGLISEMRHVANGREHMLRYIMYMKPNLLWFRGGTLSTLRDIHWNAKDFTDEDLETLVLDGGANGVIGRPRVALNFLLFRDRLEPVLYTLSLEALLEGLETQAINLVSEHEYDLRITVNTRYDWHAFADFCRRHLQVQDAREFVEEQQHFANDSALDLR